MSANDIEGKSPQNGEVVAGRQRFEMRLATCDFCSLFVTQIVLEETAFCFDNKISALNAVVLDKDSPIGIVSAERGRNSEPPLQLCVEFVSVLLQ